MSSYQSFLVDEVPVLLKDLDPKHRRRFGLMTAQHMVEHLIWVTKSSVKDFGLPPDQLTEGQKSFMQFVKKGAFLYHRPSNKSQDDLPVLKMSNLEEAVAVIPSAVARIYSFPTDHIFFNPMMGVLTFDEMERFHYMHFKYHLQHQFGLGLY